MLWFHIIWMLGTFHLWAYAADWQPPVVVNILVGVAAYYLADLLVRVEEHQR